MVRTKKCNTCGGSYEIGKGGFFLAEPGIIYEICPACAQDVKAFIDSKKEGTLAVGLLDYIVSVYGEEEIKSMLDQRGDKNGGTEN